MFKYTVRTRTYMHSTEQYIIHTYVRVFACQHKSSCLESSERVRVTRFSTHFYLGHILNLHGPLLTNKRSIKCDFTKFTGQKSRDTVPVSYFFPFLPFWHIFSMKEGKKYFPCILLCSSPHIYFLGVQTSRKNFQYPGL